MGSKKASSTCGIQTEIVNVLSSCRVCMGRSVNMKSIFDENDGIIEKVEFCTGLIFKKDDALPSNICSTCLHDLSIAHEFKTTCIQSNETLRKLLTQIKTEEPENDYEDMFDDDEVKDVLKDVLKLNDINISKAMVKSEDNCPDVEMLQGAKKRRKYKKRDPTKPKRVKKYKFTKLHCVQCDIKFSKKAEFDLHKKTLHKETETWICEICGKVFVHRSSHYTHVRSHLPPEYACANCDYKTWYKHDLVKHTRIHTGVKNYQCELCAASYHTSSNLTCHIKRFHQRLRPFSCHMCERTFYDRTKLNRHIDAHNEIKRYECSICHSCFSRRCYWKKHLESRHGVVTPAQRPGRQKINLLIDRIVVPDPANSIVKVT